MPPKIRYTKELVNEVAMNFDKRSEFSDNEPNVYKAAQRNGWIDDVCSHMISGLTYWNEDNCKEKALEYNSRGDFSKFCPRAYKYASRKGILDVVCNHMPKQRKSWSKDSIKFLMKQCETRKEFQEKYPDAYKAMSRYFTKSEINAILPKQHREYSFSKMEGILKGFKTISALRGYENKAYAALLRWPDETEKNKLFSILEKNEYKKRCIIYLWRSDKKENNEYIYKIGVTSKHCRRDRIYKVSKAFGCDNPDVIIYEHFENIDVYDLEKKLLEFGKKTKKPEDIDGKTELRTLSEDEVEDMINLVNYYKQMDNR